MQYFFSNTPNLEMEAFFRRNCNEITFIEGSAMDSTSLQNVKVLVLLCIVTKNNNIHHLEIKTELCGKKYACNQVGDSAYNYTGLGEEFSLQLFHIVAC